MYLDTANLSEIESGLKTGVISGVTTNPTILKKECKPRLQQIDEIMQLHPHILFVQLLGDTVEKLVADFDFLNEYALDKNYPIGIKVPMNYIGLEVVQKIKQKNPHIMVLGTAIYSADQVILSALAGCDYVAPYVNRMQNNGIDPFASIHKMRKFIDDRKLATKILAASFKNTEQITNALLSGAHTCTIPIELLKQMMEKQLAISAIDVFNSDGAQLG